MKLQKSPSLRIFAAILVASLLLGNFPSLPVAVFATDDCEHSFDSGYYYVEADGHYLECDNCSFYDEESFESHVNEDNDDYCDLCDYIVGHEHTYDSGYYHGEADGHYAECDQCAYYDEATVENHVNEDGDDYCDLCEYTVGHVHSFDGGRYHGEENGHYLECDNCTFYDEDSFENHVNDDNDDYCDICEYTVGHEHTYDSGYYHGEEAGHYAECDQCSYYDETALLAHTDEDDDRYCDVCDYYLTQYTVIFQNWDGTVLSTQTYIAGEAVVAPADPTRPTDGTYIYTFSGWDKEIVPCAGDAVYTATYRAEVIYGDADGNGEVNNLDAILILQWCARWDVTLNEELADVNCDGKVNNLDAILILQWCAGWNVTLGPQE